MSHQVAGGPVPQEQPDAGMAVSLTPVTSVPEGNCLPYRAPSPALAS